LVFEGSANFERNRSAQGNGDAVNVRNSNVVFNKKVRFTKNSYKNHGSAIFFAKPGNGDTPILSFEELANFEENQANCGAAICIFDDVQVTFSSGLVVMNNSTVKPKESGAIPMEVYDSKSKAIVSIVQTNPTSPTIFRGNRSGNARFIAVYMNRMSSLDFTAEVGDIDLYDEIVGDDYEIDNVVTINAAGEQFNAKEGGSISNVMLVNKGNLNLLSLEPVKLDLSSFTNCGKVKFVISGHKGYGIIKAEDSITLKQGTVLDIVLAPGMYEIGILYDILSSKNSAIVGVENIVLNCSKDYNVKGKLSNDGRTYSLEIARIIKDEMFPALMKLIDNEEELD
jgi:hypothetical protein